MELLPTTSPIMQMVIGVMSQLGEGRVVTTALDVNENRT